MFRLYKSVTSDDGMNDTKKLVGEMHVRDGTETKVSGYYRKRK